MYHNMNLCYIILLNFLLLVNVFALINARKDVLTNFGDIKENDMKLGNISRAKRASVSLCSKIKNNKQVSPKKHKKQWLEWLEKQVLPCAIPGKTLYQEQESWKFFFLTHIQLCEL